jgi:hypothetical protein
MTKIYVYLYIVCIMGFFLLLYFMNIYVEIALSAVICDCFL